MGSKAHHSTWPVWTSSSSSLLKLMKHSYVFATLFSKLFRSYWCSPYTLRLFNVFALIMTMSYASDCRSLITRIWKPNPAIHISKWIGAGKSVSPDALHTALNIALFPLLFFFSGLFYTDVLSTCIVLRMYRLFLERKGAYTNSHEGLVWMYFTGIVALTMRQTNIFWISVFLGGLELVRTIKITQTASIEVPPTPGNWKEAVSAKLKEYSQGEIHDIPIRDAAVHGMPTSPHLRWLLTCRLRFMCHQYRRCGSISTIYTCHQTLALRSSSHLVHSIRYREWWCCIRYFFP